jgi:hypothetical protein
MLVKYVSIDGIPQAFLSFGFVDIHLIVITVHDRFWNVGQANCICGNNSFVDAICNNDSFFLPRYISFFCLV